MLFCEATIKDIPELHEVRMSVKENVLNNPLLVQEKDYEEFLTVKCKGWLCKIENKIVGFAIIDVEKNNVWALFVHPDFEKNGIGKKLQSLLLEWHF